MGLKRFDPGKLSNALLSLFKLTAVCYDLQRVLPMISPPISEGFAISLIW